MLRIFFLNSASILLQLNDRCCGRQKPQTEIGDGFAARSFRSHNTNVVILDRKHVACLQTVNTASDGNSTRTTSKTAGEEFLVDEQRVRWSRVSDAAAAVARELLQLLIW